MRPSGAGGAYLLELLERVRVGAHGGLWGGHGDGLVGREREGGREGEMGGLGDEAGMEGRDGECGGGDGCWILAADGGSEILSMQVVRASK